MKSELLFLLLVNLMFNCMCCAQERIIDYTDGTEELRRVCEKEKAHAIRTLNAFMAHHNKCRQILDTKKIFAESMPDLEFLWVAPFFYEKTLLPSSSLSVFWCSNNIAMVMLSDDRFKIMLYKASLRMCNMRVALMRTIHNYQYVATLGDGNISIMGVFLRSGPNVNVPVCFGIQYGAFRHIPSRWFCGNEKSVDVYKAMEDMHDYLLDLYKNGEPINVYSGYDIR